MEYNRQSLRGLPRWTQLLPFLLIAAAVVLDIPTPPQLSTFPLLAAAPVAAAPLLSLAGTVAAGCTADLAGLYLVYRHGGRLDFAAVSELVSIVVLTIFAAGVNQLMSRDQRMLRSARDMAEAVQRAVLPPPPARIGPLAIAARYTAAEEEAAIGGDLYAVQRTRHGVRLLIGDVRGKGPGAVEAVTVLLGAFREAADRTPDLPDMLRVLERAVRRLNELREDAETFATAVVAEIGTDFRTLRMANRGHPAPLLVDGERTRVLEPRIPALPLGLGDLAAPATPIDRFDLAQGTALLLFTDGVTEARDRDGVFYDPLPRMSRPVPPGPDGLLDALLADLTRHTGRRLTDDVALLAVVHEAVPSRLLGATPLSGVHPGRPAVRLRQAVLRLHH
ncbi:PP2C family protein-serine/threonine phosphatase [Peterkaempfera bronchialis]|nr:PP2C family protein-serine/threonine phosphatase [Peterkaempfera bronchialis]